MLDMFEMYKKGNELSCCSCSLWYGKENVENFNYYDYAQGLGHLEDYDIQYWKRLNYKLTINGVYYTSGCIELARGIYSPTCAFAFFLVDMERTLWVRDCRKQQNQQIISVSLPVVLSGYSANFLRMSRPFN